MLSKAVAEMQRRLPAVPWDAPIRVHFACDGKPLYGCRLCILRYGLKAGDHTHLFTCEAEASSHTVRHAEIALGEAYARMRDRAVAAPARCGAAEAAPGQALNDGRWRDEARRAAAHG